jgi:hypothetical protein
VPPKIKIFCVRGFGDTPNGIWLIAAVAMAALMNVRRVSKSVPPKKAAGSGQNRALFFDCRESCSVSGKFADKVQNKRQVCWRACGRVNVVKALRAE